MCGIVGKIDFADPVAPEVLERMCAVIEHRGPDSRGFFLDGGVGLGVQRLAIIDVAGGDQPIFNEDQSLAVVMNGEIYNYRDLRAELLGKCHQFSSHTDTEVLVHLYEEHGERLVERLRGMFAFALWDSRKRRLLCARDRVGKKPLFWARHGSRVWFASELQALLQDPDLDRVVDPTALVSFLALQYVPTPRSAFMGIHKIPPASTLTVSEDGDHIRRYWSLDYSSKHDAVPIEELEERLREQIREATRIRLMSDVPLGAFLSGGVDSSAIVAAMAEELSGPVKTFSIGFPDEAFDELGYARIVAERFSTDHHEFIVRPDALSIMSKLARHYGEPFADPSAIPSFHLAELAGRHVTVALNGDGGDESFAGYSRYLCADRAPHLDWVPRGLQLLAPIASNIFGEGSHDASFRTKVARLARILAMPSPKRYATAMSAFDDVRRSRLLTPEFASAANASVECDFAAVWDHSTGRERVDRMLDLDVQTYLPGDLLVKMDIATMASSVEARSPFLDHHLMEFAARLPADYKLNGTASKWLLRQALRGWIPDEILDRPKMGFGVPLARWFREDLRDLPAEILLDRRSLDRGYFRAGEIESLIREHCSGAADHSLRLWVLLQLEMWHRDVVEVPPQSTKKATRRASLA
jgi:asparagine synthase (glutamine-hydrolysing)